MQNASRPPVKMDALHLGVLIRMLRSRDASERDLAVRALRELNPEEIANLLKDPKLVPEAISYFARHAGHRQDWIEALLANPSLSAGDRALLVPEGTQAPPGKAAEDTAAAPVGEDVMDESEGEKGTDEENEEDLTLAQRIQKMNVGQKIKTAMRGDKEVRTILIKDNNRDVYMAVLKNPGIKENEIEMLTKNTGTNVEVLRAIASNREWVANRNIMMGLVLNPKTPVNISIRFLSRLGRKDVEFIAKSRSLPMALRNNAKRIVISKARKK